LTSDYDVDRVGREELRLGERPKICRIERNQDYMSKNFERWKELAGRCLGEQDPATLAELAGEMNLVLTQKNTLPRSSPARGGVARRQPTRRSELTRQ
jgi:hypothetical protein